MKDVLIIQQPSLSDWEVVPGFRIAGNQHLDQIIHRVQQSASSQSDAPTNFRMWKAEGKKHDLDGTLLEECGQWGLSHYEVFEAPSESQYRAIVMLYYQPVVRVPIAA